VNALSQRSMSSDCGVAMSCSGLYSSHDKLVIETASKRLRLLVVEFSTTKYNY